MESNDELVLMYDNVAALFAQNIEVIFDSEATLQARWAKTTILPFDRTSGWSRILRDSLQGVWENVGPVVKAQLTDHDVHEILKYLVNYLDFNLFSQVYMNLQTLWPLTYDKDAAAVRRKEIEAKWAGKEFSPVIAKKAVKGPTTPEQLQFNSDFALLKTLSWIEDSPAHFPGASFRVSPKGSTPALIDSHNISSVGIWGDEFIRLAHPGLKLFHLTWDQAANMLGTTEDHKLICERISYPFISASGGSILNDALFARSVMYEVFITLGGPAWFVPRLNSLMIITNENEEVAFTVLDNIRRKFPEELNVVLHKGPRALKPIE